MQAVDKTFLKRFSRVVALSSFNRNINNWMVTIQGKNYFLKEITVQDNERQVYQSVLIRQLLQYCQRKNRNYSQFWANQVEIKFIKEASSMKYLVIREYQSGWSLKRILADKRDNILHRLSLKKLIYSLLDLFINTIDLQHILLTTENIFIREKWDGYYFAINLTSISDYFFLKYGKTVSFQYFQVISPYLFKNLAEKNNPKNGLLLKLRALAVAILSLILQKEICFTFRNNTNNSSIDLKSAEQYFESINDKFIRFLGIKWIKESIKRASEELELSNLSFFLQTMLITSEQNMSIICSSFNKWSSVLKFFKHNYLDRKDEIFKLCSLQKLRRQWSNENDFSKDTYRKWGIAGSNDLDPEDYMLYATKKYGLQRNLKIYYEEYSSNQDSQQIYYPLHKPAKIMIPSNPVQKKSYDAKITESSQLLLSLNTEKSVKIKEHLQLHFW